ncbi:ABC1 kinase family protein [Enemella sp. A6]|uniref:ABC1 kinase family protein n=1 Tax=Enemella sp. A6 TaxID=3440152 RepID=UPI003EC09DCD
MAQDRRRNKSEGTPARGALARGAKLASLPLGLAGRATAGLGRRLSGRSAEEVNADLQRQAAEQLFRVLGDLKGGAMKVGQALSLVEAAMPEEYGAPFREHLRKLQEAAPPMATARVHAILSQEFGPDWRDMFSDFRPRPSAAASIGQVHRAVWADTGEPVAVKVQYPGADEALQSDLKQLARLSTVLAPLSGGIEVKPLVDELTARVGEEVDYALEAAAQQRAADGFADSTEFFVPSALAHTSKVIVSQWVDGTPLMDVAEWPAEDRNRVGLQYARFLFAAPERVGLLHADPHPGNFRVMPDGRLGVLDFGGVQHFPDGLPPVMGRLLKLCARGDADVLAAGLADLGFIAGQVDPTELIEFLTPFVEPAAVEEFHFTRDWMRHQSLRVHQASGPDGVAAKLNLPPEFLMIDRVYLGAVSVLSQLDVRAPFAGVLDEFLPGWRDED